MQKNVHVVPDDGFLHFYTLPFLFQLLAISYLKKKKKRQTNSKNKKEKNWSNFLFWDSALAYFLSDNSLGCLSQVLFTIPVWMCHTVLCCFLCALKAIAYVCVCVCVFASLSLRHIPYWEYKQESCWLLFWTDSSGATSFLSILSQVIEWNWSTHSTRCGSWLSLFPGWVIGSRMEK